MSEEQNQQQQQNDNGKEAKKFEANIRKFVALLGGDKYFKRPKVDKEELPEFIAKLAEKKKETLYKEFEAKMEKFIEKKIEFDKFIKQKQKELDDAVIAKKKEFNKDIQELFGVIDRADVIEKEYYTSLKDAVDIGEAEGGGKSSEEEPTPSM